MTHVFEVGDLVRACEKPEWGVGQVQSSIGGKITVTFENQGKVVLAEGATPLELVRSDWL